MACGRCSVNAEDVSVMEEVKANVLVSLLVFCLGRTQNQGVLTRMQILGLQLVVREAWSKMSRPAFLLSSFCPYLLA